MKANSEACPGGRPSWKPTFAPHLQRSPYQLQIPAIRGSIKRPREHSERTAVSAVESYIEKTSAGCHLEDIVRTDRSSWKKDLHGGR